MKVPSGRFVWHDLTTADPDGAARFYTQVAPWTTQPWDDEGQYTMWMANAVAVGGVRRNGGDGAPADANGWLPSVYVYDVDACVRQVPALGGRVVMPPREIPGVGCWAIVADPSGASLALFEPSDDPPGHSGAPRVGEFSWHDLATTDGKAAFEFYHALFHWEKMDEHDMGANGPYIIFGRNGENYGGIFKGGADAHGSAWTSYVRVEDTRAAAEKVRQLGGRVVREPHQVPGGDWISHCVDPQGVAFALNSGG
jgi:uncharacterized protein